MGLLRSSYALCSVTPAAVVSEMPGWVLDHQILHNLCRTSLRIEGTRLRYNLFRRKIQSRVLVGHNHVARAEDRVLTPSNQNASGRFMHAAIRVLVGS